MKHVTSRFALLEQSRRLMRASILVVGLAGIGCTDVITTTKDSENKAAALYRQGSYSDAAGAYRNAARQNPRDFKSYYMMGQCYEQLGERPQAISAYMTSLDVQATTLEGKDSPDQKYETIRALGSVIAASDARDTETNAAVAKAQSSQKPEDYLLVAQINAVRGDPDSAIDAYEHASLLGPTNFYVAKSYGLYLEKIGQRAKAESQLRHAYALKQTDAQVIDGLRRLGVVPGPSLKDEQDLVKPPLPKGPLPESPFDKRQPQANPQSGSSGAPVPRD